MIVEQEESCDTFSEIVVDYSTNLRNVGVFRMLMLTRRCWDRAAKIWKYGSRSGMTILSK